MWGLGLKVWGLGFRVQMRGLKVFRVSSQSSYFREVSRNPTELNSMLGLEEPQKMFIKDSRCLAVHGFGMVRLY